MEDWRDKTKSYAPMYPDYGWRQNGTGVFHNLYGEAVSYLKSCRYFLFGVSMSVDAHKIHADSIKLILECGTEQDLDNYIGYLRCIHDVQE